MRPIPSHFLDDLHDAVRSAALGGNVLDIVSISEGVRMKHLSENVALEDVVACALSFAKATGLPIVFEHSRETTPVPNADWQNSASGRLTPAGAGKRRQRSPATRFPGAFSRTWHWSPGFAGTAFIPGRCLRRQH